MGYNSDDQVTISNEVLSEEFMSVVGGIKISTDLRECIKMIGSAHDELGETKPIEIHSNLVEVFSHITPEEMAAFQKGDNQISTVYPWVQDGKVLEKSILYKIKSKFTRKLFYQLDRLFLNREFYIVYTLMRTLNITNWSYHNGFTLKFLGLSMMTWVTRD